MRELNSLMHCEECGAGGALEGEDLLSTEEEIRRGTTSEEDG